MKMGERLGLEGPELRSFVLDQQAKDREDKRVQQEREERRLEREAVRERELKVAELEEKRLIFEAEQRQLDREAGQGRSASHTVSHRPPAKTPKMPTFQDGDDMDSYLTRFERVASLSGWEEVDWAGALSALLTGKALETYSRMAAEDARDYLKLKQALLGRYELTEEGYRAKFRSARPEKNESPPQFITRLQTYLRRWIELSGVDQTMEGVTELLLKEQFLESCPSDLVVHLKMNDGPLPHLASCAETFLSAHKRSYTGTYDKMSRRSAQGLPREEKEEKVKPRDEMAKQKTKCFKCRRTGHRSFECTAVPRAESERQCFRCLRTGHLARDCKEKREGGKEVKAGGVRTRGRDSQLGQVDTRATSLTPPERGSTPSEERPHNSPCHLSQEEQEVGRSAPQTDEPSMPLANGLVGTTRVQVLRDTGCDGVIVKSRFVQEQQFTGIHGHILRIDNTVVRARKAVIDIDTPFLRGTVVAHCLDDALYDLIVGNVSGAQILCPLQPELPDEPAVASAGAVTRAKGKARPTPLKPSPPSSECIVDKTKLIEMQEADPELSDLKAKPHDRRSNQGEVDFCLKEGVRYRVFTHPRVDHGKPRWQVLVPKPLREHVMRVAHESIFGGHMGIAKTMDRVSLSFYWPGIRADIKRFCQSCDRCQKTVKKGSVPKAPVGKMPLISEPFKRVAVDLVGPIHPASEDGHKYILTLVDYATRYPEAVPLKNIDTETVAEALVGIYSRTGFPEEILSDLGTQFVSDCMAQVARLLSIRQLTTTPYNPACNGLVERFNGTLKTMLRRLCSEQPKLWHRFLGPLLFAYREVPQDSTGFSPFELMYGRNVRGPMQILRKLWTEEEEEESEPRASYRYVLELRDRLEATLELAQEQLGAAQRKQRRYADAKAKSRSFKEGDEVLILLPTDHNKLLMQWKGPYPVTKCISPWNCSVKVGNKEKTYHVNLLKQYVRREQGLATEASAQSQADEIVRVGSVAVVDDCYPAGEGSCEEELLPCITPVATESTADVHLGPELSAAQASDLKTLLETHREAFTDRPGKCTVTEHRIKLSSDEPVTSKPYQVPLSVREGLQKDLEDMQRDGIIRPSESPYASPIVIVKKRDSTNRLCIDFRKLNRLTEVDPEPVVPVKDVVQALGGDTFFSKLDMARGYWQISMAPEDVAKTAFVTQQGKYECLRMPFGLVNAGATLTRCLREVLAGLHNVATYFDDILVHTRTWAEHVQVLDEVLRRLSAAGLTLKPSKCELGARTVDFLGHRISGGEVRLAGDNAEKIEKAERPRTKKEVRSFLGLCNFYRDFIPHFATLAAPLTDLTKKGFPNQVVWGDSQEEAYRALKEALIAKPILRLPDPDREFVLRTDASDRGLGAMLCQRFDDGIFPVSYASRKLLTRETKYSVMERECLALVWAVKKYGVFLYGKEFVLQTDHKPLLWLKQTKYESDRVMRWAMFLQSYPFRIEAIKGRDNVGADFLSRAVREEDVGEEPTLRANVPGRDRDDDPGPAALSA